MDEKNKQQCQKDSLSKSREKGKVQEEKSVIKILNSTKDIPNVKMNKAEFADWLEEEEY